MLLTLRPYFRGVGAAPSDWGGGAMVGVVMDSMVGGGSALNRCELHTSATFFGMIVARLENE